MGDLTLPIRYTDALILVGPLSRRTKTSGSPKPGRRVICEVELKHFKGSIFTAEVGKETLLEERASFSLQLWRRHRLGTVEATTIKCFSQDSSVPLMGYYSCV